MPRVKLTEAKKVYHDLLYNWPLTAIPAEPQYNGTGHDTSDDLCIEVHLQTGLQSHLLELKRRHMSLTLLDISPSRFA